MRLSLLDRSRTRAGEADGSALVRTAERASRADELGYDRFWVAEHHAVPGIASGSPAVLLAAITERTSRIRLGSGGVMLPLHQPIVVAEQFLMLDAFAPGRIDLGVGRSLGFTPPVRTALRRDTDDPDTYEADLSELHDHLAGTAAVTARPATSTPPPMFVLATGTGTRTAARLGLPVVLGGPILGSDELPEVVGSYRRTFRSHDGSAPRVIVSLDVLVADDDAAARQLALPEAWAGAMSRRTGSFEALQSPADIDLDRAPDQVRGRVETSLDRAVAGAPATVRRQLEQLAERTGADELLASGSTFDTDALGASDRMLRDILA